MFFAGKFPRLAEIVQACWHQVHISLIILSKETLEVQNLQEAGCIDSN